MRAPCLSGGFGVELRLDVTDPGANLAIDAGYTA